jgi:hypothetical protein
MLFSATRKAGGVVWWVAYQRGSFSLKERYECATRAQQRCGHLVTHAQYLRVIPHDDIDGCADIGHCLELPPIPHTPGGEQAAE